MDKILLLGEHPEAAKIEQDLGDEYRVQKCAMILENVEGMMKIIKPDMIIACQLGGDEATQLIFKSLRANHPRTPILITVEQDEWNAYSSNFDWDEWNTLFFPVEKEELKLKCSVMITDSKDESGSLSNCSRKTVMLVDDNAIVLRNIKALLQEKYDVMLAVSGPQALKMIEKRKPDMILLDYEMPEMSGAETFERLKLMKEGKDIPVVFLTGVSDKDRIVEVLKLNPAGYVLKPPKQDKLLSVLEETLGK